MLIGAFFDYLVYRNAGNVKIFDDEDEDEKKKEVKENKIIGMDEMGLNENAKEIKIVSYTTVEKK